MLGIRGMIVFAIASFSALMVLASTLGHAQEAEYKPSWQATCGYLWRNSADRAQDKSRAAYTAFQRKSVTDGGCGAKATRGTNDEKIKQYLETHPRSDATDDLPTTWQDARRGKK